LHLRNPEKFAEAFMGLASRSQTKSKTVSTKLDCVTGPLAELIAMKAQSYLREDEFSTAKSKLPGKRTDFLENGAIENLASQRERLWTANHAHCPKDD
jgi:hypothetical protein